MSEIEAANNSGSIFVIVFKFFINPNFEASAIAIFKIHYLTFQMELTNCLECTLGQ